ncbi:hypothetical protein OEJ84_23785 (plasmid) [Bacillus subtilis]|uniref:Uncharacterized protein n=1 Tax=Bacillus phage vB_BsuS_PJN02 TaxID=2920374 RepID=A0AC61TS49_9CAUD|nr:hypothetical protein [Bacillus subtilis]YP_010681793.1 hypothetical protein PQE76_gp175 [Bacillus phage vB_BsuS_PJN02]UNH58518.1 hypothetical protein [Bacillus phage vB_BsuS_PJN02]WOF32923.1 hypothetical protein OEJ84_23785 [Bacillus subtilis]
MFMYYLSICLIVWLSVGLMMGLKAVYIDKFFNEEKISKFRSDNNVHDDDKVVNTLFKNKLNFIIVSCLCGVLLLVADIIGTIKNAKAGVK